LANGDLPYSIRTSIGEAGNGIDKRPIRKARQSKEALNILITLSITSSQDHNKKEEEEKMPPYSSWDFE
jgi:hypothetical protein